MLATISAHGSSNYWIVLLLRESCLHYFLSENAVNNFGNRQWITFQQEIKFLPRHVTLIVPAIKPPFPTTLHLINKHTECFVIPSDSVIGVVASHFRFELFPLLSNRLVHVLATPLVNALYTSRKS